MEKLQKALEKARQERQSQGGAAAPDQMPLRPSSQLDSMWQGLASFAPDPKWLLANRIMTLTPGADANPFDLLRTKVQLLMKNNGWTRIAITSPSKNCGKTTLACNLAMGFSRQPEMKTILFDTDLRRANVRKMLGHVPQHDIYDLLTEKVSAQKQFLRLGDNVAISMAQHTVNDPTQALLSQQASRVLDDVQAVYEPDVMIFDLPPMLVTDDARAMLKNVDCVLILAHADHTKMSQLDVCEREVSEHTNVLGIVLNNCRYLSGDESVYGDYY